MAWQDLVFFEGSCGHELAECVHVQWRRQVLEVTFEDVSCRSSASFSGAMSATARLEFVVCALLVAAAGAENGMTLCVLGWLPVSAPAAVEDYSFVALQSGRHP